MPPDICEYHTQLVSDIAVIKNDLQYIKDNFCKHIVEADAKGGFRDRIIILEQNVSALKKAMWMRVGVAGVIGGLVGSGSADAIALFLKWVMKGGG